jgi:hypothetical protein
MMVKFVLAAAMSAAALAGPSVAATTIIDQECALWDNACKTTCEAKYPKAHIVAGGGAIIGGGMHYSAQQRADLIAACRITCMATYPVCKK